MQTVSEEVALHRIADAKEHKVGGPELPGPSLPLPERSVWHKANPVTLREWRLEFPLGNKTTGLGFKSFSSDQQHFCKAHAGIVSSSRAVLRPHLLGGLFLST